MPDSTSLQLVIQIVADTFSVDPATLSASTIADDVEGWDSVSHAFLVMALEERSNLLLSFEETAASPDLGALASYIEAERSKLGTHT